MPQSRRPTRPRITGDVVMAGWSDEDLADLRVVCEHLADACFGVSLNETVAVNIMIRMGLSHRSAVKLIEETRAEAQPREQT